MHNQTHEFTLTKVAKRALRENVVLDNLGDLLTTMNTKSLKGMGWQFDRNPVKPLGYQEVETLTNPDGSILERHYEMYIVAAYANPKPPDKNALPSFARKLYDKASSAGYGSWTLSTVDGKQYVPIGNDEAALIDNVADSVGYTEVVIPDNYADHEAFQELYGLDDQREITMDAIKAAIDSNWVHRNHVAYVGPPACGKSALAAAIKAVLGDDAVVVYDATAITAPGIIKDLTDREILPRIIIFEECEKVSKDDVLDVLLSIMDTRGQIKKNTARTNIERDAKMFVVATINDWRKFKSMRSGAVADRFNQPLGFNRPSREMQARILRREVERIHGDMAWIEPTLDYCDEMGITSPRRMIGIMTTGKDKLLTGEHQRRLRATSIELTSQVADWTTMVHEAETPVDQDD